MNKGLPIYKNSSVISAAEFWLSRSFGFLYPGEYVGLFEGCHQLKDYDTYELKHFFSIVSKAAKHVKCPCLPAIELSNPYFRKAKICFFSNVALEVKSHLLTKDALFSLSELERLHKSHPDFNMSYFPTVDGFIERILKVINGIRGHNRAITPSSSNERLVQTAKD